MSLKYPCFLKSSSFSTRVELKSKDQRTLCSLSQNQKKNETSHSVIHSFHVHRCFKVVLCNLVCAIPLAYAKLEFARVPSLNKQTNKHKGHGHRTPVVEFEWAESFVRDGFCVFFWS